MWQAICSFAEQSIREPDRLFRLIKNGYMRTWYASEVSWLDPSDQIASGGIPLRINYGVRPFMSASREHAIGPHCVSPLDNKQCGPISFFQSVHVKKNSQWLTTIWTQCRGWPLALKSGRKKLKNDKSDTMCAICNTAYNAQPLKLFSVQK